jgi:hypothetical protein
MLTARKVLVNKINNKKFLLFLSLLSKRSAFKRQNATKCATVETA